VSALVRPAGKITGDGTSNNANKRSKPIEIFVEVFFGKHSELQKIGFAVFGESHGGES